MRAISILVALAFTLPCSAMYPPSSAEPAHACCPSHTAPAKTHEPPAQAMPECALCTVVPAAKTSQLDGVQWHALGAAAVAERVAPSDETVVAVNGGSFVSDRSESYLAFHVLLI